MASGFEQPSQNTRSQEAHITAVRRQRLTNRNQPNPHVFDVNMCELLRAPYAKTSYRVLPDLVERGVRLRPVLAFHHNDLRHDDDPDREDKTYDEAERGAGA